MKVADVQTKLREIADPVVAEHSQRFFKTGAGEYGEGDQFLGIRVPDIRKIAKRFEKLSLIQIEKLLHSGYHEERLCALIILVNRFKKANPAEQERIYKLYLANTSYVNNWDLVDTSAYKIVGPYLEDRNRDVLYDLAKSDNLWERRIAIISTLYFVNNNDFKDTLAIAEKLLDDNHDLIHKATGWMLREVGKRDQEKEESFLEKHASQMPRTMLRYAIEHFSNAKRKLYLNR
ncbi:MAG: DNA alkylation repair protein [Balneolaceae bacterium]|nr:DNA alkylation repair protein [Balneolaceae bacterium]